MTKKIIRSLKSLRVGRKTRACIVAASMGLALASVTDTAQAHDTAPRGAVASKYRTAIVGPAIRLGAKKIWHWVRSAFWNLIDDVVGSLVAGELKKRLGSEPDAKEMHATLTELLDEVVRQRQEMNANSQKAGQGACASSSG